MCFSFVDTENGNRLLPVCVTVMFTWDPAALIEEDIFFASFYNSKRNICTRQENYWKNSSLGMYEGLVFVINLFILWDLANTEEKKLPWTQTSQENITLGSTKGLDESANNSMLHKNRHESVALHQIKTCKDAVFKVPVSFHDCLTCFVFFTYERMLLSTVIKEQLPSSLNNQQHVSVWCVCLSIWERQLKQ